MVICDIMFKNKILKSFFRISIILSACLIIIWAVIARPVYISTEAYESEFPVNKEILKKHVFFLSETLKPRSSKNRKNLNEIADYIHEKLSKSSSDVEFQKYNVKGKQYKNVIANFGPKSDEVIVVGAHYDAYSNYPGADDNASGIAGLIELGKLLNSKKLNNRIMLVAYTLEEPPYFSTENMGSFIHANSLKKKDMKIKIMIALEMIGYFSDENGTQDYPVPMLHLFYPNKGNFIAIIDQLLSNNAVHIKSAINKYTNLKAYSINAPSYIPGIDFSDHRNYWHFGYPAVMVTDTAFYRNHEYHTSKDTYERLNYENMAKTIYGIFKYIQKIDTEI